MVERAPTQSSGVLMYRRRTHADPTDDDVNAGMDVLIGHMGGPFWAKKHEAAWSIPKGEADETIDHDELATACREFREETGHDVPPAPLIDLGVFEQSRTKEIHIWAVAGDLDATLCRSNLFEMEWPPRSGRTQQFPEIDRFEWASIEQARIRLIAGQRQVLDALVLATCPDMS